MRNEKYKNSKEIKAKRQNYIFSESRAITLISLVITIVLLIILAGLAISLSMGENGLFSKTKYAKEKYLNAQSSEEQQLNELYEELGILGDLPKNTPDTKPGTLVEIPDKWNKYTPAYISNESKEEVVKSKKVASVYAVAVGEGKEVPIPYGFYYVGGNLDSGVVISDNKLDQNKYKDETEVPNGIEVKEGKFVDILKGNQFVFIPCKENEYKKSGSQGNIAGASNCYWGTEVSTAELTQVERYGGFYVARYEAGLPTSQDGFSGDEAFTSALLTPSNSLSSTSSQYNSAKTPISKAGREPWNFVDYNNSWASAKKMYNTNSVKSGLITGTQWDVMINKIASADSSKSLTDSKTWGNYYTGEAFTYNGRVAEYKTSDTKLYGYESIKQNEVKENKTYRLLTTGGSEHNKAYNLYDVAGNLWEWTEESAAYFNSIGTLQTNRIMRGGCFHDVSTDFPACFRYGHASTTNTYYDVGFREVLYIM